jgi:hypothetical protein
MPQILKLIINQITEICNFYKNSDVKCNELDFSDIINDFAARKSRKVAGILKL